MKTLGTLCDTPEGLKKPLEKDEISSIFARVEKVREDTGLSIITLTGGDPLWNDPTELHELLSGLTSRGFEINIETSGTISWLPYVGISENIFWVLDYKLKSAGVKNANKLFLDPEHLQNLTDQDFIKFVVYDGQDLSETLEIIEELSNKTKAKLAIGAYWGGKLDTFPIFKALEERGVLGKVVINMQTHKMALTSNYEQKIPEDV